MEMQASPEESRLQSLQIKESGKSTTSLREPDSGLMSPANAASDATETRRSELSIEAQ